MSQSRKVLTELGSLIVKDNAFISLGSVSALSPNKTPQHVVLGDSNVVLTIPQLQSGVLVQTPTVSRTITLPSADIMASFLKNVGDTFDFHILNEGGDAISVTLVTGLGGTSFGSLEVRDKVATTTPASGTSTFRIRQTSITDSSEAYILYRLS